MPPFGLKLSSEQMGPLVLVLAGITAVLLLWNIALSARIGRLLRQQRNLLRGAHPGNVIDLLEDALQQGLQTRAQLEEVLDRFRRLADHHQLAFQRRGLVRFDAFNGVGGQQSFALALLDANKDGVVISSLFGREGARVYAKPVENGRSTYTLSREETQAIEQAAQQPAQEMTG